MVTSFLVGLDSLELCYSKLNYVELKIQLLNKHQPHFKHSGAHVVAILDSTDRDLFPSWQKVPLVNAVLEFFQEDNKRANERETERQEVGTENGWAA